jgi:hypothetical protein
LQDTIEDDLLEEITEEQGGQVARAVVGAPIEELVISPNLISPNLISPNLNASPKAAPPAKDEASKKIQALMRARAAKAYVSALKAGQQVIMRSP